MIACVHPKYGTPTATAVGEAMWDQWLVNATQASSTARDDGAAGNASRAFVVEAP